MNYREALAWLYALQRFGIKLGLETIHRLIGAQEIDLGRARVIHVAGTNGKGSVCAMIESMARATGCRTGLFTSPHLISFRERIRVSGEMISEDAAAAGLSKIHALVEDWNPLPTFFEVVTALALKHFSDARVDLVILETGLGGRLDATNAVKSSVSVITPIDLDHQQWLGESLREIATEKAGIIKAHTPVISAPQAPEAEKIIRARAGECDAPLKVADQPFDQTSISLQGAHQRQNAAIAIAALRAAGIKLEEDAIARGLGAVEWPARFQRWDERTIIDGAHNPAAARTLVKTWRELFGDQRATLILAILSDKDVRAICEALAPISEFVFLPRIRSDRSLAPEAIAQTLFAMSPRLPCSIVPSVANALDSARAKPGPILITGSLHFAGEALAHLRGEPAAFEECTQ